MPLRFSRHFPLFTIKWNHSALLIFVWILFYSSFLHKSSHAKTTSHAYFLITSPTNCDDESECSTRRTVNTSCVHSSECEYGLYCGPGYRCQKQLAIGSKCNPYQRTLKDCALPAICSPSKNRCILYSGLEGQFCETVDSCRRDKELFCNLTTKRCQKNIGIGDVCPGDYSEACAGFCSDGSLGEQKCFAVLKEGDKCFYDSNCNTAIDMSSISPPSVCNKARGEDYGICVSKKRLLKQLGLPCNPKEDRCDLRRGLSCVWDRKLKKSVCKQGFSTHIYRALFCTPGNRFGQCKSSRKRKLTCKTPFDSEGKPYGFFQCEDSKEKYRDRRGRKCSSGTCEDGTECMVISGVRLLVWKGFPKLAKYCVKVVGKGELCANKFRTICAKGTRCRKGNCVSGVEESDITETHADAFTDCSDLPCAHGLVCKKPDGNPVGPIGVPKFAACDYPVRVVGISRFCLDTSHTYKKCAKGLECTTVNVANGIFRCVVPRTIGEACARDLYCQGKLQCFSNTRLLGNCMNVSQTIGPGKACEKGSRKPGEVCGVRKFRGSQDYWKCLKKGNGFACQTGARLFEACSAKKNIGCFGRNVICGKLNVCVSSS